MSTSSPSRPASRTILRWVLVGLFAGTATGLFLGEEAGPLEVVADAFVRLLQMAVLPYVTVSIIASIGGLRVEDLRALGARAALVLGGLWLLALTFAFLMPLTFPPTQNAAFFSTTLLEPSPRFDFVDLYIPANPFFALANNIVPAVVLFSIVVGVALVGLPRRQVLLDVLEAAGDTLGRVMRFVVRLTPYGVFAIAATTAGALRLEEAGRLQLYLAAYGALALLLALWVLPGLVAAVTPIPVRAIFASTREPLLTATIAGDLFIVLPLLIGACKDLVTQYGSGSDQARMLPDVIVPVSYNFPHGGKLLSVSFILFAAWFSGAAIPPADYPQLGLTALVTLFGSTTTAMPFLLDLFRVPADTFQLFVASTVINSRLGTLVAAMHTVTMALLGTCAVTGTLRWRPRTVARHATLTVALTAVVLGSIRMAGAHLLSVPPAGDVLDGMRVEPRAEAVVLSQVAAESYRPPPGDRLTAIGATRTLRACYLSVALPFAFINARGELVGLDVALMHQLALELGVRLIFLPIDRDALDRASGVPALLQRADCDLVIGGMAVTTARAGSMLLSSSYLDETLGFVVADSERRRFASWDAIRAAGRLTIAVPDLPYYLAKLQARLPQAQLRTVKSIGGVLDLRAAGADALAIPAERGSAWTLRYPQYSVVVPPEPIKVPLAYAMPRGEAELAGFVNTWLDLKRKDGTLDALYQYWILGRDAAPRPPRWSIIRDVLHWIT